MSNWNIILEWNNDLISTKGDKETHTVLLHTIYYPHNIPYNYIAVYMYIYVYVCYIT